MSGGGVGWNARTAVIMRHLPYFAAVAEHHSYHRASRRLNIAQSALSRRVLELERELGVRLFERTPHGAALTAAGEDFYNEARLVLNAISDVSDRVRTSSRGDRGRILVGMNEGAVRSAEVTGAVRAFRVLCPHVQVELRTMLTNDQLRSLADETLDVGFLYDYDLSSTLGQRLNARFIASERLRLIVPRGHPLATKHEVRLADLEDCDLVLPSQSHCRDSRDQIIAAFDTAGVTPRVIAEVMSGGAITHFVAAGLGVGFVLSSERLPDEVISREVTDFDVRLRLCLTWRRSACSPVLLRFLQHVTEIANRLEAVTPAALPAREPDTSWPRAALSGGGG